jgi:hypothetical protein
MSLDTSCICATDEPAGLVNTNLLSCYIMFVMPEIKVSDADSVIFGFIGVEVVR